MYHLYFLSKESISVSVLNARNVELCVLNVKSKGCRNVCIEC